MAALLHVDALYLRMAPYSHEVAEQKCNAINPSSLHSCMCQLLLFFVMDFFFANARFEDRGVWFCWERSSMQLRPHLMLIRDGTR